MPYWDVSPGRWSAGAIDFVSSLGLMSGFEDGTFRPEQPLTREQFASALERLVKNQEIVTNWNALDLRSQLMPAVVHIDAGGATGSGAMVHPSGIVATCDHVVKDASLLLANWPEWFLAEIMEGAQKALQVIATDPANDLALCKVEWDYHNDFPFLRLADKSPAPAEPVVMLGSPASLEGWEAHGLIARPPLNIKASAGLYKALCIAGAVNPGNSGGPLVNAATGRLSGIVSAKLSDVAIEGMGFAVPVEPLRALMEQAGVEVL